MVCGLSGAHKKRDGRTLGTGAGRMAGSGSADPDTGHPEWQPVRRDPAGQRDGAGGGGGLPFLKAPLPASVSWILQVDPGYYLSRGCTWNRRMAAGKSARALCGLLSGALLTGAAECLSLYRKSSGRRDAGQAARSGSPDRPYAAADETGRAVWCAGGAVGTAGTVPQRREI